MISIEEIEECIAQQKRRVQGLNRMSEKRKVKLERNSLKCLELLREMKNKVEPKDHKEVMERVALRVCEVVAEEGNTPPSCIEYWGTGAECYDDWCEGCQSVVKMVPVLTDRGKEIASNIAREE